MDKTEDEMEKYEIDKTEKGGGIKGKRKRKKERKVNEKKGWREEKEKKYGKEEENES